MVQKKPYPQILLLALTLTLPRRTFRKGHCLSHYPNTASLTPCLRGLHHSSTFLSHSSYREKWGRQDGLIPGATAPPSGRGFRVMLSLFHLPWKTEIRCRMGFPIRQHPSRWAEWESWAPTPRHPEGPACRAAEGKARPRWPPCLQPAAQAHPGLHAGTSA